MNPELQTFITKAREKQLSDDVIRQKLLAAGWDAVEIDNALSGAIIDGLEVPLPPTYHSDVHQSNAPISVVENLSSHGFEYSMMFSTLLLSAIALIWILNGIIYAAGFSTFALPLVTLLVTAPLFLVLFFRLRTAESQEPELKQDPSRRKLVQSTERLSFVVILFQTIGTLYAALEHGTSFGIFKVFGSWLISVFILGSIFAYFWHDTHSNQVAD